MDVSSLIVKLVKLSTWEETREMLEANQSVLLSDEAEKAIDAHIINADGNLWIQSLLEQHKVLIQDIRQRGIPTAFQELSGKKRS